MEKKEYIERDKLIKWLQSCKNACIEVCKGLINNIEEYAAENVIAAYDDCIGYVESAPAADMVEVVRCKDCKRSGMYDFGCGDRMHLACLEIEEDGFVIMATAVNDDDFCSRGERREE